MTETVNINARRTGKTAIAILRAPLFATVWCPPQHVANLRTLAKDLGREDLTITEPPKPKTEIKKIGPRNQLINTP